MNRNRLSSSNKTPQLLYAFPVQNKFDLLNGIQETVDGATVENFGSRKQPKIPKTHPILDFDALVAGKKKLGAPIVPGAMLSVKYHKTKRNKGGHGEVDTEKSKEESFDSDAEQMAEERMKKKAVDDVRKDDGSKKKVTTSSVKEVAFSPRRTGDGGLWDKKTGGPRENGEQTNSMKETVNLEDTSESEEEEMDLCTKWNRRKTKQWCKKFEMGSGIPSTLVSPSGALDPLLGKSNECFTSTNVMAHITTECTKWELLPGRTDHFMEVGLVWNHGNSIRIVSMHINDTIDILEYEIEASSHHRPEDPNIQYWRTKDGEWLQLEFVGENDGECFVDWISKAMKANNRDNTETRGLKRFPPPSLIPDGFFWNQFNGRLHRKLQGGREVQEVVLKGRAIVSYYDEISDEFYKFREDWMDVGLFYSEESKSLRVFAQNCASRELEFSRRLLTPCEEVTPRTPFKCSHIKLSNETVQFFFLLIDDRDEFNSAIEATIRHKSDPNKFPVPKPHTLLSYETESGVFVINEGDLQSNSNSRNSAQRGCTPDSPCINLACLRCLPLSRRRMRSPRRIETARQETRDMREVTAETKVRGRGKRHDEAQWKETRYAVRLEKEKGRNNLSCLPPNLKIREDVETSMWEYLEANSEAYPEGLYLNTDIWRDFCISRPTPMEISSPYLLMGYFHTKMAKELVDSPLQHNLMVNSPHLVLFIITYFQLQIHQDLGVRMDDRQRLILENSRNIKIHLSTNSFVESWKPVEAEAGPTNGYSLLDDSDAMDFSMASSTCSKIHDDIFNTIKQIKESSKINSPTTSAPGQQKNLASISCEQVGKHNDKSPKKSTIK
ncbi:hypothetical protein CAEBREN_12885 [Caenorhabditis brenneri]|uniref:Uncharacterized protein n=1 Tax=Caenorhabditis brenneri TaxID=135651 RepID=G0NBH7_CAEBE|nr:hypothetical protein CAEBREN_12885 [Caenorhabditis brenneri]